MIKTLSNLLGRICWNVQALRTPTQMFTVNESGDRRQKTACGIMQKQLAEHCPLLDLVRGDLPAMAMHPCAPMQDAVKVLGQFYIS